MTARLLLSTIKGLVLCGCLAAPVAAQTITGTPGSPAATTTINGLQIPAPPQTFQGKIERNAAESDALLAGDHRAAARARRTCC